MRANPHANRCIANWRVDSSIVDEGFWVALTGERMYLALVWGERSSIPFECSDSECEIILYQITRRMAPAIAAWHMGARTDLVVATALASKKIIPREFPLLKVLGWR